MIINTKKREKQKKRALTLGELEHLLTFALGVKEDFIQSLSAVLFFFF